jgi:hypothetical protein
MTGRKGLEIGVGRSTFAQQIDIDVVSNRLSELCPWTHPLLFRFLPLFFPLHHQRATTENK